MSEKCGERKSCEESGISGASTCKRCEKVKSILPRRVSSRRSYGREKPGVCAKQRSTLFPKPEPHSKHRKRSHRDMSQRCAIEWHGGPDLVGADGAARPKVRLAERYPAAACRGRQKSRKAACMGMFRSGVSTQWKWIRLGSENQRRGWFA